MRFSRTSLHGKFRLASVIAASCLGIALLAFGFYRIFAEPLGDDARVYENDQLTYYITVNSDGIDHESVTSSDSQIADEVSGVTTVTDVLPDGLTFEGFVTSPDGTFGAVQRDDKTTQCSGRVIDDTNEDSIAEGAWNADETEYTYHGLHYDANTRKVTFRTKGIGAGCELTVGVITRTPYLGQYEYRKDFYDHASFVDESLFGNSNTVHAWIEKSRPVDNPVSEETPKPEDGNTYYSLSYELRGDIPLDPPSLPAQEWHKYGDSITIADIPDEIECYSFDGWWGDFTEYYSSYTKVDVSSLSSMPYYNIIIYGILTNTCTEDLDDNPGDEPVIEAPEKYNVSYEIDGTKPTNFNVPSSRSYYEGANVLVDTTNSEGDIIDGYDFSGWETDDVALGGETSFTMPKKNVLLRGSFEQQSYVLSYEFIGDVLPENADSLLPAPSEQHMGDMITIAGAPSVDGYTFSGWYSDPSFEMPAKDVVIKGEWIKNKVEFTPGIVIEITNPQNEFHKDDTVEFKITISNDKDFDLNNVWLEELLDGAIFVPGDGYSIESDTFVSIDTVPANGSAVVYAKFDVTKNIEEIYTNTIELISADITNQDYAFPNEWNNKASVDFATGILSDIPIDEKENVAPEPGAETPMTYDGLGKMMISGATLAGGLALCIVLSRKVRRGGIVYGYYAVIMIVSGLAVVMINGGGDLFADALVLRPSFDIKSENANYDKSEAGAWDITESATWTGVGEATLKIKANTKHITNLHKKDVILVMDNGAWTRNAIDGTLVDREDEPTTMELMRDGAVKFANELLADGDSSIVVIPTWGEYDSEMTDNINIATSRIMSVVPTNNSNYDSYNISYRRIIEYLDNYTASEDRQLNIVFISDDHFASSTDIALYRVLQEKAPNANISSIGFGVIELMNERYTDAASANEVGVIRFWSGVEGNLYPIGSYNRAVLGLDKISKYHENPSYGQLRSALIRCVDTSTMYEKFNISTTINLEEFDIKGIFGNDGDINVDNGVISWTNEGDKSFVSGASYEMNVLLKVKDSTVEKHKLYRLNTNTVIESDARDIEAENIVSDLSVVLMNGYEVTFDINNNSTCSIGDNQTAVYLALQQISIDESNVSCEGWNFDIFRSASDGSVYSAVKNKMPAEDLNLKATWRKVDVEVHMDGTIYVVAPAVLKKGIDFNESLQKIRTTAKAYSGGYALLESKDGCPSEVIDNEHRISDDDSPTAVYAWISDADVEYDNYTTGSDKYTYSKPFYYCTEADTIKLNEDSSRLFFSGSFYDDNSNSHDISQYIKMVEGIENWDASDVKSLDYAFRNYNFSVLNYLKISDWDTSNVESMDGIFEDMISMSSVVYDDALSGWDTSNVKSMKRAFANNYGSNSSFSRPAVEVLGGIANWDVSNVEDMSGIFDGDYNVSFGLVSDWNVTSVKNLDNAFRNTAKYSSYSNVYQTTDYSVLANWGQKFTQLESMNQTFANLDADPAVGVDLSALASWNVSTVKEMRDTFSNSKIADLSALANWDTGNVEEMVRMFYAAQVNLNGENAGKLNGLENWDTSNVKTFARMFEESNIVDLSALASWNVSSAESLYGMLAVTNIVSLDGLENWDVSNVVDLGALFCDDGMLTDINAISGWNIEKVETMRGTFAGIAVDDMSAVSDWDTSSVKDMSFIFCSTWITMNGNRCEYVAGKGVKSLNGIQAWDVSNVENMSHLVGGSPITDLSPISGWDVSKVKNLGSAFSKMENLTSLEPLLSWTLPSLEGSSYGEGLDDTFAYSKKIKNLHGIENWDTSRLSHLNNTFSYMDSLEDITALSGWDVSNVASLGYTFAGHKKLTSLSGLENWDVSNVRGIGFAFMGYSPYTYTQYTNWSEFCSSSLTDISALNNWGNIMHGLSTTTGAFSCNDRLQDLSPLSTWTVSDVPGYFTISRMFEGDKSVTSLNGLENLVNEDMDFSYCYTEYMFAYMTGLRDISALASWKNDGVSTVYMRSMFMNDRSITSLAPLEDTFLKYSTTYNHRNAFDNIPSSVARPSWN